MKTAQNFVPFIKTFIQFLKDCNLMYKLEDYKKKVLEKQEAQSSGPLNNKNIVITGFRDKEFIKTIEQLGGNLSNSVSKSTHLIIIKDADTETTKLAKGKKLNIPIIFP